MTDIERVLPPSPPPPLSLHKHKLAHATAPALVQPWRRTFVPAIRAVCGLQPGRRPRVAAAGGAGPPGPAGVPARHLAAARGSGLHAPPGLLPPRHQARQPPLRPGGRGPPQDRRLWPRPRAQGPATLHRVRLDPLVPCPRGVRTTPPPPPHHHHHRHLT